MPFSRHCPSPSLAAADAKGVVSVFDVGQGEKVSELPAGDTDPYLYSLKYSPCSGALATGSKGGVKIYDVREEEGKLIKEVSEARSGAKGNEEIGGLSWGE